MANLICVKHNIEYIALYKWEINLISQLPTHCQQLVLGNNQILLVLCVQSAGEGDLSALAAHERLFQKIVLLAVRLHGVVHFQLVFHHELVVYQPKGNYVGQIRFLDPHLAIVVINEN